MSGVDIKSVQELLGHASLIMTMKYFHLAPDHRLRAITTLDLAYQTDTTTDTVDNSGLERSTEVIEKTGGADGTRTRDPLNAIQVLFQLSYSPSHIILQSVTKIR